MHWFPRALFFCFITSCSIQSIAAQQNPVAASSSSVLISAGVPLRVVLDNRTPSDKLAHQFRGHLAQSIYVFDRLPLPAGTEGWGTVADVHLVSKRKRANAIIKGDFTPLKEAQVQFSTIVLKDGTQLPIQSTGAERDSAVVQMSSSGGEKGLWNRMKGL